MKAGEVVKALPEAMNATKSVKNSCDINDRAMMNIVFVLCRYDTNVFLDVVAVMESSV